MSPFPLTPVTWSGCSFCLLSVLDCYQIIPTGRSTLRRRHRDNMQRKLWKNIIIKLDTVPVGGATTVKQEHEGGRKGGVEAEAVHRKKRAVLSVMGLCVVVFQRRHNHSVFLLFVHLLTSVCMRFPQSCKCCLTKVDPWTVLENHGISLG